MGLDSVEIVMGWEEALGVTITDAGASTFGEQAMLITGAILCGRIV
jgi:acyl carrier protein